tara:strand:+ start:379 stop:1074 length:696 start_codon:yes stop_codon:yes gene_type:complete
MQVLEKNIKGFNILELIVVLAIIGVISAAAYPKFSTWKQSREVRTDALKAKKIFESITAQVQRGQFAFVQVLIGVNDDSVVLTTRGMKTDTLAQKINDGDSAWNASFSSRCDMTTADYWDVDGSTANDIEVQSVTFNDITTNLSEDSAVCFAKNARWFSGAGDLLSGTGDNTVVDESLIICNRDGDNECELSATGEPSDSKDNLMYSLDWTRFGEITLDKWSSKKSDWVLQ